MNKYRLDPAPVPKPTRQVLREMVSEFLASGLESAKVVGVESEDEARRIRSMLATYISRNKLNVKVACRDGAVYLIRILGEAKHDASRS